MSFARALIRSIDMKQRMRVRLPCLAKVVVDFMYLTATEANAC